MEKYHLLIFTLFGRNQIKVLPVFCRLVYRKNLIIKKEVKIKMANREENVLIFKDTEKMCRNNAKLVEAIRNSRQKQNKYF